MHFTGSFRFLLTAALLIPPQFLRAQPAASRANGTVRGEVFDSLAMQPVARALVWLPGTVVSTQADDRGHYTLTDIPAGAHVIAFSTPALDSLGLGTLGANANVTADNITQLKLTTPSFATIWRALCKAGSSVGTDSGIVFGTLRDAASDTRLFGARTRFNWYDMRVGADKKLAMMEITRDVRSDSTGTYYACGLPIDIAVFSEAEGARSASGVVQYAVGSRRLLRVDLLVSTDMVNQPTTRERTSAELIAALKARGTSTVRGTVRDEKNRVQVNASVMIASVDSTVITNDKGEFVLAGLPAGTHDLEARQLGFAPRRTRIDLHPGAVTEADLTVSSSTKLATVNVRAQAVAGSDRADYEHRRREGFGYALEAKDIKDRSDMTAVLQGIPSVTTRRVRGQAFVVMDHGSFTGGECVPLIWIDGTRSDMTVASSINPQDLRAVEVFPRAGSAPPMYVGLQACGVILFWTKMARW